MPKSVKGRLIAKLIELRAKANALLSVQNRQTASVRYVSRHFRVMQRMLKALQDEFPGEIDSARLERYGRNLSEIAKYLDERIEYIKHEYSSASTGSSASSLSS